MSSVVPPPLRGGCIHLELNCFFEERTHPMKIMKEKFLRDSFTESRGIECQRESNSCYFFVGFKIHISFSLYSCDTKYMA